MRDYEFLEKNRWYLLISLDWSKAFPNHHSQIEEYTFAFSCTTSDVRKNALTDITQAQNNGRPRLSRGWGHSIFIADPLISGLNNLWKFFSYFRDSYSTLGDYLIVVAWFVSNKAFGTKHNVSMNIRVILFKSL